MAAASFAVLLAALGVWLGLDTSGTSRAAPPPPPPPPVQHFKSRPDLQPPTVTILRPAQGTSRGYVFLAPKREAVQPGPMIIDDKGQVVWFNPLPTSGVTDFKVQRYRGKPVLTWWQGTAEKGVGVEGGYHIVDSSYRLIKIVRAGNGLTGDIHEFKLLPGGIALMTIYRKVPADLSELNGYSDGYVLEGIVQELSVATGRVLFEWHSLPDVPLSESNLPVPENEGTKKDPYDYFHVNSAEIDSDGNLLVSARHTSAIYKINRRTRKIMWRLGGKTSDFTFGPGARFAWQHDARRRPDGTITLFDNAAQAPTKGVQSKALRLRVDCARTAPRSCAPTSTGPRSCRRARATRSSSPTATSSSAGARTRTSRSTPPPAACSSTAASAAPRPTSTHTGPSAFRGWARRRRSRPRWRSGQAACGPCT